MALTEKHLSLMCENGCITAEVAYEASTALWTCDLWLKNKKPPGTMSLFVKGKDEETLEKAVESSYQQFYLFGNQIATLRDGDSPLAGARWYTFTSAGLWIPNET